MKKILTSTMVFAFVAMSALSFAGCDTATNEDDNSATLTNEAVELNSQYVAEKTMDGSDGWLAYILSEDFVGIDATVSYDYNFTSSIYVDENITSNGKQTQTFEGILTADMIDEIDTEMLTSLQTYLADYDLDGFILSEYESDGEEEPDMNDFLLSVTEMGVYEYDGYFDNIVVETADGTEEYVNSSSVDENVFYETIEKIESFYNQYEITKSESIFDTLVDVTTETANGVQTIEMSISKENVESVVNNVTIVAALMQTLGDITSDDLVMITETITELRSCLSFLEDDTKNFSIVAGVKLTDGLLTEIYGSTNIDIECFDYEENEMNYINFTTSGSVVLSKMIAID